MSQQHITDTYTMTSDDISRVLITLNVLVMILRRFNGGISANGDDIDAVCTYNSATYILNSANAT